MSAEEGDVKGVEEGDVCCACCGITQVDDINLQECTACQSVWYCSDKCQENHREQHDEECKKRLKEFHDDKLFRQPDSTNLGECPICCLPMPLEKEKCNIYTCCGKLACKGCVFANYMSNKHDNKAMAYSCLLCREPMAKNNDEDRKRLMKRLKASDPNALNL
jgi:hypothetical protein